jgi:hypothetical protein
MRCIPREFKEWRMRYHMRYLIISLNSSVDEFLPESC